MPVKELKKNTTQTSKRYRPPPVEEPPDYAVELECPMCGGRVMDLSDFPPVSLYVGLKCPHCNRIVHMQCKKPQSNNTS